MMMAFKLGEIASVKVMAHKFAICSTQLFSLFSLFVFVFVDDDNDSDANEPGARITLLVGLPLCKHWPSLYHDHWSNIGGGYILNVIISS